VSAAWDGAGRFAAALAGAPVSPPVAGLSFVDPWLLGDAGTDPPAALTKACRDHALDFAFVPSWEPWAARAVPLLAEAGVAALWVVPGVLWTALEAVGIASGLRAVVLEPLVLADPLDSALETALTAVARGAIAGAVAIVVADDLAGDAGPLVDPAFLRRAVFPRLAALAALAEDAGLLALLHTDGDVRALMTTIAAYGFAGVHGDAAGGRVLSESLASARAAGLTALGGIPTLALADDDTARAAAVRARELADNGGLVLTDDGGLTNPPEASALLAALDTVRGR